ncbi:MAG: ribosomal-processing cysteine protease Prp [Lachnospiraceae bacterium]|nr:ribosomal-processing cysteine protease Prp [Lachnospiraceae bacterium]
MIQVIIQTHNQEYKSVISTGHADYAEAGSDIVCSAASILLINTANSVEKFTDSFAGSDADEGILTLVLKDHPGEDAKLLIDSLILGLESIQKEYGKNYLTIDYKEV